MKSYRKVLIFNTKTRRAFINITPQIEKCLRESGIKEGLLLCNPMHITSSVFINDDESGLHRDFEIFLEKLAPPMSNIFIMDMKIIGSHLKRTIMERSCCGYNRSGLWNIGTDILW